MQSIKERNEKNGKDTKTVKHVRIMDNENIVIGSPTQSASVDDEKNKKIDAKKSKFCSIL